MKSWSLSINTSHFSYWLGWWRPHVCPLSYCSWHSTSSSLSSDTNHDSEDFTNEHWSGHSPRRRPSPRAAPSGLMTWARRRSRRSWLKLKNIAPLSELLFTLRWRFLGEGKLWKNKRFNVHVRSIFCLLKSVRNLPFQYWKGGPNNFTSFYTSDSSVFDYY